MIKTLPFTHRCRWKTKEREYWTVSSTVISSTPDSRTTIPSSCPSNGQRTDSKISNHKSTSFTKDLPENTVGNGVILYQLDSILPNTPLSSPAIKGSSKQSDVISAITHSKICPTTCWTRRSSPGCRLARRMRSPRSPAVDSTAPLDGADVRRGHTGS